MHMIFPERFSVDDELGMKNWDYYWMCEHTWSKWHPEVEIQKGDLPYHTWLTYDSAWCPNNGTLQRLSKLTWWEITNEYEETWSLLAGTFICRAWDIVLDEERTCLGTCGCCEERFEYEALANNDEYSALCQKCISELQLKVYCGCGEQAFESEMTPNVYYCPECRERDAMDQMFSY
jgi:hypothetical protein